MVMHNLGHRESGLALAELALPIGMIAIIVVGGIIIFNTVRGAQDRSTALANVGVIRSAVATWAGDEPLRMDTEDGLLNAAQLRPWLPGRLGNRAKSSGLALSEANPWDGDYVIEPAPPGASADGETGGVHPYRFVLVITDVPDSEAQALCRQLAESAALDPAGNRMINFGSRGTGGCTTTGSDEEDAETLDLYVEYRV